MIRSSIPKIVMALLIFNLGENTLSAQTTAPVPNLRPPIAAPKMTEGIGGVWPPPTKLLAASACSAPMAGSNRTFHVGPGRPYTELTNVPWLSLQAGDVVNIYYRPTPYKTKFGLRGRGTADRPIHINGVTDGNCRRPIISGDGAVTATDSARGGFGADIQANGLIQIYRLPTDDRETYKPQYISIQNLELVNAQAGRTFRGNAGDLRTYDPAASAIYAIRVAHLTVENCSISDNGNGVFTNTRGQSPADFSSYVIIRRNLIRSNGNLNRSTEHGLYIQAYRALYEGNFIGQDKGGSSMKDRSSGTVIRYNRIHASARAIDLVETEEEGRIVQLDPLYHHAWVYGNLIINDVNAPLGNSARPIHWGHDNTAARARNGTLFFYGNTYYNRSRYSQYNYVTTFQIGDADSNPASPSTRVEAAGNIFWNDDGTTEFFFLTNRTSGSVVLRGTNYIPKGWSSIEKGGTRVNISSSIAVRGDLYPVQLDGRFVPTLQSPVLDRGIVGPSFTPAGATAANLKVVGEFTSPAGVKNRVITGSNADLGAFERY